MTTNSLWLDAFSSSSAQLKSDYGVVLLALEDLAVDGCDRLVALIIGQPTLLKVMKGPEIQTEIVLDHLATTMCTFYLDPTSPAIAVGAGPSLFIYKNFKPFYKYTTPPCGVDQNQEDRIVKVVALPKSSPSVSKASLLLIGTEHCKLLVVDPQSFTAITQIELGAEPKFIQCSGCYDDEAVVLICSADSRFLLLQSCQQPMRPKTLFTLNSPVVEFCFNGSVIAAATMDHSIRFFDLQGLEKSKMKTGSFILSMTWVEIKQLNTYLLAVSLANGVVQLYKNSSVVGQFDVDVNQPIAFMVSGRFSREDDVLIMLSKAGELMVKIINRGFRLAENPNSLEADSKSFKISNRKKPLWQPKTKVFVEQALREQEDPKSMFQQFEEGMSRIHVYALNEWNRLSLRNHQRPAELTKRRGIHMVAHLMGFGPQYCLQLQVVNITDEVIDSLTLLLHVIKGNLKVDVPLEKLNFLFPSVLNRVSIPVQDVAGNGGHIIVTAIKNVAESFTEVRGVTICSAQLELPPTLPPEC